MPHKLCAIMSCVLLLFPVNLLGDVDNNVLKTSLDKPIPNLVKGAQVFQSRCTLCHGNNGMGEGMLPLSVVDYPSTNLVQPRYGTDTESLLDIVIWGGTKGNMSMLSPPWGDELTWTEIESVVQFIEYLRKDTEQALALLKVQAMGLKPSLKIGRELFNSRCALCHGAHGTGDGKMAKIIRNPPPFNLTKSRMPDDYLTQIIGEGGQAVGRSAQMPPWKQELSATQIKSVVMYIKTMRE